VACARRPISDDSWQAIISLLIHTATRGIVVAPARPTSSTLVARRLPRQDSMADELLARLTIVESTLQNVERRTERIERFLPTLASKEELRENVAALRAELREDGERTRRHFDVVAERMRDDIRLVAEGHLATEAKFDRHRLEQLALERRVTTLEIAELARGRSRERDERGT
jgi:hypothetical protein